MSLKIVVPRTAVVHLLKSLIRPHIRHFSSPSVCRDYSGVLRSAGPKRYLSLLPVLDQIPLSPITWAEKGLQLAQASTGLPWWATIITCTIALRSTCTLPLAVQQRRRVARLESLQPLLDSWRQTIVHKVHLQGGNKLMVEKLYKEKRNELLKTYNCHPFKTILLPFVQIPLWITISLALRRMAAFPAPFLDAPPAALAGLVDGGSLWFIDLTAPDPTMIFPLSIGFLHLLNVELNRSTVAMGGGKEHRLLTFIFRTLAIIIIPVSTQVPMILSLFWATSAGFSVIQNCMFWLLRRAGKL
ncbi:60Kd inner membrane protein-domain-containing protein [Gaertneriomyces semiglobifer]|nr:60Kd inner membrane protein-domain-containing protein [Gaertneriomyces semiglobifer]